jgi:multidrug efflux pump subunit AcrA (membrane-fusion protein)
MGVFSGKSLLFSGITDRGGDMKFSIEPGCRGGIAFAFFLLCLGCGEEETQAPLSRPIRAIRIGDEEAFSGRTFPGTAEAVEAVDLSFRVGGPLVSFPGKELGKQVNKGDVLAEIDTRDFQLRLRDTEAALAKAESELQGMRKARPEEIEKLKAELERAEAAAQYARVEYERFLKLKGTIAASASEVELAEARSRLADADAAAAKESLRIGEVGARPEDIKAKESQIKSLEAAVQKANDDLTDTKLVAPFSGSISASYVDNFQVVQPKEPIVRLVNTSELEIRVDIPENLIALVPTVQETFVTIQAFPDLKIPAQIAEIGTEASPTTRTYPVKLRFKPPEGKAIRAGMTGIVTGRGDPAKVISAPGHVVPTAAVFDREGKRMVWVYDPTSKTVQSREITVLGTTPFGINVSGVEVGEWVVNAGVHYLDENQTVRLLTETAEEGGQT